MITTTYAGVTDIGRVRKENEDRWFADPEQGLYMIADGMGGSFGGGLAAQIVIEILPRLLRRRLQGIDDLGDPRAANEIKAAVAELSTQLRHESKAQLGIGRPGSTVVLALVHQGQVVVAHLGDSRAYLLHGNRLEQLTKDHSMVQLLLDCGAIKPEEAAGHPARNQLTRFVGMPEETLPEARLLELAPGDRLLLCSDGLSGVVSPEQLSAILQEHLSPEEACSQFVSAGNEAGGKDNITAVVVAVANSTS